MLQTLTPFSKHHRLAFAENFRAYLADHPSALPHIWFSDEAHFWLFGHVNKQNCRIWSEENPRTFKTTELHPKWVTVWAALSAKGIISPFFTDETVTGPWYQELLNKHVIPKMCKRCDFLSA